MSSGKGVQSISRKSVCTARSPNAATLSSYSFDRNPLGLCTQSLMALFKDRYRSMTKPLPSSSRSTVAKEEYFSPPTIRFLLPRLCFPQTDLLNTALTRQQTARCQKANTRIYIYIGVWLRVARDRDGSGGKYVIRITVDPLSLPDTCVSWNDTWPIPVTRFTSPVHRLSLSFLRELFKRIVPPPPS